ncbi:hypothetical protein [Maricaulis sp.]|uniref:hypothetical protein n=1 Tax=Maricaulis sp. TaxID=1486257 RepID=UPI0026045A4F|nr:hypothetical protein [Maricaulis sp.]
MFALGMMATALLVQNAEPIEFVDCAIEIKANDDGEFVSSGRCPEGTTDGGAVETALAGMGQGLIGSVSEDDLPFYRFISLYRQAGSWALGRQVRNVPELGYPRGAFRNDVTALCIVENLVAADGSVGETAIECATSDLQDDGRYRYAAEFERFTLEAMEELTYAPADAESIGMVCFKYVRPDTENTDDIINPPCTRESITQFDLIPQNMRGRRGRR